MKNWYLYYGFLGLAGFADSLYLTFSHFRQHSLGCSLLTGCDEVLTSVYSEIWGIPVALFGVIYYLTLASGALLYYQKKKPGLYKGILAVNLLGFFISLYFVYVQWAYIGAYCQYCILSSAITTIMLIIILFAVRPVVINNGT
jgi:uncharacterized membrane protein